MKANIYAGAVARNQIRHYLNMQGIDFKEDKRFFSSNFYFDKKHEKIVFKDIENWQKLLNHE